MCPLILCQVCDLIDQRHLRRSFKVGMGDRLIALDSEQMVGCGVADGLGDLRIPGEGVDG